ncbi:MAG: response regulator [Saprospiraceae bacterium]|nr:response regulator [Saprospiraceae bacterium]
MESKPLHILLADDDEADRLIFTDAFSELDIKTIVHTVNDGDELMEWLNKESVKLPHMLFLDLNMPRVSGLQCLKEIRGNEKLKKLLIAIYSTSDNEKDMEETFLNGANIYIVKPPDFNTLKKMLRKAVDKAHLYQDDTLDRNNFFLKLD